jgi:3-hydroxy acid dehydrogenase / malonic semialdehyde reductase
LKKIEPERIFNIMRKTALVTGASSGFGYACAVMLAKNGYNLILNARRKERIDELAHNLEQQYQVSVHRSVFDVRDRVAVFASIESIPGEFGSIDVLINNAGLALGLSELPEGDVNDWETMIDTNVKGLLYVSKAVMPGMISRGRGHIINIGSVAGRETYPKGNVYCATKHAVKSLSTAMRIELVKHNIKVTLVSPGAADTEFSLVRFKGDKTTATNVYNGYTPLYADDIARCIEFCINQPEHVNIDDMLVMPSAQASATIFNKNI